MLDVGLDFISVLSLPTGSLDSMLDKTRCSSTVQKRKSENSGPALKTIIDSTVI